MTDSPINFMLYGHTPSFLESQQLKNRLLKEKLSQIVSKLNTQKQQNLRYLKQIDSQQQTISSLKQQVQQEQKRMLTQTMHTINTTKELTQNSYSSSQNIDLKSRTISKSTELPNKKVYLDINNKSIDSSFQHQIFQKKLKMEVKDSKRITSYGNLYNKKSFSLNKFKLK